MCPYPAAMGFLELTDVSYRPARGLDAVRGRQLPRARGGARRPRRRERHRQVHAAAVIAGDEPPDRGRVRVDGRVGLMRQFIGSRVAPDDGPRLPSRVRGAARCEPRRPRCAKAERWMRDHPGEQAQLRVRGRARALGRRRRVRGRGAVRPVHARGVRTGVPGVRRTPDRDALRRRAQAARARGDLPVARST